MPISNLASGRNIASRILIACCFTLLCLPGQAQQSISSKYTFVTIDYPGAPVTYVLGINNKKQMSGYYLDATFAIHGFLYSDGKFTAIEYPGAAATAVGGINDRGDISGTYIDQAGFQHGFLRTIPDGCDAEAVVRSWRCEPNFTSIDFPGAAEDQTIDFEFGPGLGTASAGLNDRRQVVGLYATQELYSNGFVFSDGRYHLVDNPDASHTPGNGTKLFSINNLGMVAGDYQTQADSNSPVITHGFIKEGDCYTPVFVPGSDQGGFGTQANGINDFGLVVGIFSDPAGNGHAMLWFRGQAYTVDYPKALFSEAHTINDLGQITGAYIDDDSPTAVTHGFVATPKL